MKLRTALLHFLILLFVVVSCSKKDTTTPVVPTPPTSSTAVSSTIVSTTPTSGTPATTTAISSTATSTTAISSTAVSTTTISTSAVSTTTVSTTPVSGTTTPTVPVIPTPSTPIATTTVTVNYSDGSSSPYLVLGNLTGATNNPDSSNNYLLIKDQYTVSYNRSRGQANWVAWHLQASDVGSIVRKDDFRPDNTLPIGWYQVRPTDYGSEDGFDRGHLCPSGDRTDTQVNNSATFLVTNIIPQAPSLNRGLWENLEEYCRELAAEGNELYIYAGAYGTTGIGSNGARSILASGKVVVPARVWKVIVVLPQGENDLARISSQTTVIAIDVPNAETSKDWQDFITTPYQIQTSSRNRFFLKVPSGTASSLLLKRYTIPTPVTTPTDSPCGLHNGKQLYKGPQGGCYYINSNGNKTYVDRSYCNC